MSSLSPGTSGDDRTSGILFAQSLLPPGLELIHQLAGPVQYGMVFEAEDRRLVGAPPVVRRIRLVEVRSTETWRDKFLTQLQELSKGVFHHVCRPLEVGSAGADHVYLIFDWFPATLVEQIPATGLSDLRTVRSLFSQLVSGLEELHGRFGAHGAVCADQIFVDSNPLSEKTRLWIGGIELGHLQFWTDGARQLPQARDYFPPEWQGKLREPSKPADVFALGLLAVEIIAGRGARKDVAPKSTPPHVSAEKILRKRATWWNRYSFIPQLLSPLEKRPVDGAAVRLRFDGWCGRARAVVPISVIVIAFVLIAGVFYWSTDVLNKEHDAAIEKSRREETDKNLRLDIDLRSLRGELAAAKTQLALRQKDLDEVTSSTNRSPSKSPDDARSVWSEKLSHAPTAERSAILDSLKTQLNDSTHRQLVRWSEEATQAEYGISPSLEGKQRSPQDLLTDCDEAYRALREEPWDVTRRAQLVRAAWSEFTVDKNSPAEKNLDAVEKKLDAVEAALEKVPVMNWLRQELSSYLKSLRERRAAWVRWEPQPEKLTQAWRDRIDAPWDVGVKSREEEMLVALNSAELEWRKVDLRKDTVTWDDFQDQLKTAAGATGNPVVETITKTWIDAFNSVTTVTFQPIQGTSPKGSGVFRSIDVYIDDSWYALDKDLSVHPWQNESKHNYPETTTPIKTDWKVGQSINVKVYGERQTVRVGVRPCYIDSTFVGPIAAWRLANKGVISNKEHSLTLRVLDCPGPPPPAGEAQRAIKLFQ